MPHGHCKLVGPLSRHVQTDDVLLIFVVERLSTGRPLILSDEDNSAHNQFRTKGFGQLYQLGHDRAFFLILGFYFKGFLRKRTPMPYLFNEWFF